MENLVIITYLSLAGIAIVLINIHEAGRLRFRLFEKINYLLPVFLQFAFGGLFSVFVVFYSRSASLATSWPFLLFLILLLLGNEFFREKYVRLVFQFSIFFVALFSYSIFAMPILIGKLNAWVFVLSGIASLFLISIFLYIIFYFTPAKIKQSRRLLLTSVGVMYIAFNFFYFTNIIPPIPLSLKDSGVYHYIEKNNSGGYNVSYEPAPWYYFFRDAHPTFHWVQGEKVYFFSAVFAPTKINTDIAHRWSYFDEEKDKWIEKSKLNFPIVGGRDGGYRGYSWHGDITSGKWRVEVMTERGQILGRHIFTIEETKIRPQLKNSSI